MDGLVFEYSDIPFKDRTKRPYIEVIVTNPANGNRKRLIALIDSGAKRTVIEKSLAVSFGFHLANLTETDVAGISGSQGGWEADLNLSFKDFPRKNYDSPVVFTKLLTLDMILGEDLFFKNFKILFEGNETFKLKPITRIRNANE